jgi:hypothetical protein
VAKTLATRWSRHRAQWAAVVMVCVSGQLVGVAHNLLVRHGRCAEHGELVHLDRNPAAIPAHVSVARSPMGTDAVRSMAVDGDESHEHCSAVSVPRKVVRAAVHRLAPQSDLISAVAWFIAAGPSTGGRIYHLAPKTSPPA